MENKVPWGHELSVWLSDQLRLIGDGTLGLEDFCHDIDTNFCHDRNETRDNFMTAIKELAYKVVNGIEELEK
jgi:TorA maturation chaperone TorD